MISNRLNSIINLVPKNSIVADVGTDHGYVPVYLIEKNISKRVIATDISKGSLSKVVNYVKERKLESDIDARLGNGLEVIKPYEVDTVVIAGMGGLLIEEILKANKEVTNSINTFILQPMICAKELREYLVENNFEILEEVLIKEDGKYYEIIKAKHGKDSVEKDIYYEIPKKLIEEKHLLLEEYIEFKIAYSENILNEISDIESEKVKQRIIELKTNIKGYREVLTLVKS